MALKFSSQVRSIKIAPMSDDTSGHNNNDDEGSYNNSNGDKDIDPFRHEFNFSCCQKFQMVLMSLTLAPIRIVCLFVLIGLAGILSWIGLIGISDSELSTKPFTGWRRRLQKLLYKVGRWGFFCIGVHRLKVIGERASRSEAPILVSAPHATIIDAIPIFISDAVPVAKDVIKKYFMLGTIGRFQQALFVNRGEAVARQDIREQIKARAGYNAEIGSDTVSEFDTETGIDSGSDSGSSWRQIFIYPEGTTTNGRALIKYKTGAFQCGLPVQMVLIRLLNLNHPDTLTWTWDQKPNDSWILLWMTLCQFNTKMEIEYLPVYYPSEIEKSNARLFADNVRSIMAKHLNVPTSERRVEDVFQPQKI